MLVKLVHSNGKEYVLPTSQVIVLSDDGRPLAVTYEESGLIVHSDASKSDFAKVCARLHIVAPEVQILDEFKP